MSLFIIEKCDINGFKITPLTEYVLSESLTPKFVNYGTNDETNNSEYIENSQRMLLTIFTYNKLKFAVIINNNGVLGFGYSDIQTNLVNNLDQFTDERGKFKIGANIAAKVFSSVMYVVFDLVKIKKLNVIKFNATDDRLDKFYRTVIRNKHFNYYVELEGFKLKEVGEFIIYERS